jgi:NAD(P)H-hydrate epimerase
VTFGLPKLGLLQHPGCQFAGRVICVDIGIPGDVQDRARAILTEASDVAAWLPARAPDAHKGDAGRLLVVAGSPGLTGAGCLTARAASRAGSGLVTVAAPSELAALIEARSLETMTLPLRRCAEIVTEDGLVEIVEHVRGSDALAVGPGLGRHPTTLTAVRRLIAETDIPTVVDADGLQALRDNLRALPPGRRWAKTPMPSVVEPGEEEEPAEAPSADLMPVTSLSVRVRRGLRSSKSPLVLTPHPGEMAAILGSSIESVQENRVAAALEAAQQFGATIILKGARSVIADVDGRVAINPTGHEGMASGGMGDALTGIVVSLLGQGVPAFEAAAAGAYLHGLAAELAADAVGGRIGVLAGDLIEQLPATREAVQRGDVPPCPVEWLLSG